MEQIILIISALALVGCVGYSIRSMRKFNQSINALKIPVRVVPGNKRKDPRNK